MIVYGGGGGSGWGWRAGGPGVVGVLWGGVSAGQMAGSQPKSPAGVP